MANTYLHKLHKVRVVQTDRGEKVLCKLRDTLRRGPPHKITKEILCQFVRFSDYEWFGQAGREAVRLRLLKYAERYLTEVKPWFREAEALRPGFFQHPLDRFQSVPSCPDFEEACRDFDAFVKLGLTPPARGDRARAALRLEKTHFPNPYNTIPDPVLDRYPEVKGMTREEAWNWSLVKCVAYHEAWIKSVVDTLDQGVEAIADDQHPSVRRLHDWLVDIKAGFTTASSEDGRFAPRALLMMPETTIQHDETKENSKAEALAKRLPTFRAPNMDVINGHVEPSPSSDGPFSSNKTSAAPETATSSSQPAMQSQDSIRGSAPLSTYSNTQNSTQQQHTLSTFKRPSSSSSDSSYRPDAETTTTISPVLSPRARSFAIAKKPEKRAASASTNDGRPRSPMSTSTGNRPSIEVRVQRGIIVEDENEDLAEDFVDRLQRERLKRPRPELGEANRPVAPGPGLRQWDPQAEYPDLYDITSLE